MTLGLGVVGEYAVSHVRDNPHRPAFRPASNPPLSRIPGGVCRVASAGMLARGAGVVEDASVSSRAVANVFDDRAGDAAVTSVAAVGGGAGGGARRAGR